MKHLLLTLCFLYLIPNWALASQENQTAGASLIGGSFDLMDNRGRSVTDKDYQGKYRLVFFGFTSCPSVCPLGLQRMASALKKIDDAKNKIIPLFITVDPERDTPEVMTRYLNQYHAGFIGLTGTKKQLNDVAKAYRAYASKEQDPHSDNYTYDHSAVIYLMDKKGHYLTHFSDQTSVKDMSTIIEKYTVEK